MKAVATRLLLGTAAWLTGVFVLTSCGIIPVRPTNTPFPPPPTPALAPTPAPTTSPAPTTPPSPTATPGGRDFYVDSADGSDSNSGRSPDSPWQTLDKVQSFTFRPGDVVNFKRGSNWSGGLVLNDSGAEGNPITFRGYGTGPRPTLSNPGQKTVIRITAHWVVVRDLLIQDAVEAGVRVEVGATNNVVRDNEVMNVGIGVQIMGQYNLVTGNYAHDLHMVVNTRQPKNDDYGAEGFWIQNSDNEVSYNRCVNCRAASFDYGYDGGVVEIFGKGDDSYIHHNYGTGSQGFFEVGRGSARNVRIAYNISDNNYDGFLCLHTGDRFASAVDALQIENNTIVKTMDQGNLQLDCMQSSVSPSELLFNNNIVYSSINIADDGSFMHTHNIYFMTNGASIGYPLGPGEKRADPLFVNLDVGDYHLLPNSPAIRAGTHLGYPFDFDNHPIPTGVPPDIGAYEFVP